MKMEEGESEERRRGRRLGPEGMECNKDRGWVRRSVCVHACHPPVITAS